MNDLVEITGGKPTGSEDYIQLNQKGKVVEAELTMNGYKIIIKNGKIVSATKGDNIPLESMALNITEQTMEKDSTFKIIPTFNPENASNQEVAYESKDTNVVTVDAQGTVTAVNTGSTKVIVTSKEDTKIKAECNITVVVTATGLTVTPETATINTGETVQLEGTISPSNTTTNSLTWNSSNADIASVDSNGLVTGVSKGEVVITATTVNGIEATSKITVKELYKETILNGAYPELYNTLIPVIYSDNDWKVADLYEEWYKYNNQEWANAAVLKNGVTKNTGDIVDVSSEVQGMFVWVPRYEYKIEGQYGTHTDGSVGTAELPGEIKINFISKDTTTASNGYIMHPAFTFGSTHQSGIWVGKFKTTGTESTPSILPNETSLRGQNVTQFATAQKFNTYLNNSNIDAHMSKNSEWGAAAYLSQSKYGKYGNSNYVGINKKVMINNCNNSGGVLGNPVMITGVGADSHDASDSTSTCTINTYETAKGQAASTTGNITGIYDMNSILWERVMGIFGPYGDLLFPNFSEMNEKYYDNYTTLDITTACGSGVCYGHALFETEGWYNCNKDYSATDMPIFVRGSGNNINSGIFSFWFDGYVVGDVSFRIILSEI